MRALAMLALVACGGSAAKSAEAPAAPQAPAERMLAMLPPGAQVVIELDLARLRANPVVGGAVARALASGELPAGVPASPLAEADQVVLAAYGVGTAQAATLTVLAASHELAGASKLADGYYIVGPPDWIEQAQARVALSSTGDVKLAIAAAPELLALRKRAMPAGAPGAALRVTARLPFDARIALARQTGLDAAPAQLSAWADVADDLALIVDCDAADPGAKRANEAARRLAASLRGTLAAVADEPLVRALGLPSSLTNARLIAQGAWVRTIIAVGPAHLKRVVDRANALLDEAKPGAAKPGAKPDATKPPPAKPDAATAPPGDRS